MPVLHWQPRVERYPDPCKPPRHTHNRRSLGFQLLAVSGESRLQPPTCVWVEIYSQAIYITVMTVEITSSQQPPQHVTPRALLILVYDAGYR